MDYRSRARRSGTAVLAIDYRKVPEFKTSDCHEDARVAYEWVLSNGPEGKGAASQLFANAAEQAV